LLDDGRFEDKKMGVKDGGVSEMGLGGGKFGQKD
jgi:hypothetical protein